MLSPQDVARATVQFLRLARVRIWPPGAAGPRNLRTLERAAAEEANGDEVFKDVVASLLEYRKRRVAAALELRLAVAVSEIADGIKKDKKDKKGGRGQIARRVSEACRYWRLPEPNAAVLSMIVDEVSGVRMSDKGGRIGRIARALDAHLPWPRPRVRSGMGDEERTEYNVASPRQIEHHLSVLRGKDSSRGAVRVPVGARGLIEDVDDVAACDLVAVVLEVALPYVTSEERKVIVDHVNAVAVGALVRARGGGTPQASAAPVRDDAPEAMRHDRNGTETPSPAQGGRKRQRRGAGRRDCRRGRGTSAP